MHVCLELDADPEGSELCESVFGGGVASASGLVSNKAVQDRLGHRGKSVSVAVKRCNFALKHAIPGPYLSPQTSLGRGLGDIANAGETSLH
eukprot:scaffold32516_cov48-Phaeocystis_antarctica.AAC.1